MKILYFDFDIPYLIKSRDYPIGGTAVEWLAWLKAFKKLDHEVGLLTWEGAKEYINCEVSFDIVESYSTNKGLPKIRLFSYMIPSLIKAINYYKPDVIIQAGANRYTGIIGFCAKFTKTPYIFRVVSDMDVDGRFSRNFPKYLTKLIKLGMNQSSIISCQNNYQRKLAEKEFGNKKIFVHYNPYHYIEKSIKDKVKRNYIAWIGNFSYEKNLPALANVAKKNPNQKFLIAGKGFDKPDPEVVIGIDELKKLQNVKFVGYLKNEEIPGFLSDAICLLNTSRLEGFSNTFLEAWSVGTPVVTTKYVNPDNVISHFNLGLIAENHEELAIKISEMLNLEISNYQKVSDNCITYVKNYHDPIKLAAKFIEDIKVALLWK